MSEQKNIKKNLKLNSNQKQGTLLALAVIAVLPAAAISLAIISGTFSHGVSFAVTKGTQQIVEQKQLGAVAAGLPVGRADDRILVKFKSNQNDIKKAEILAKHGLTEKEEIKQIGVKIIYIKLGQTPEQAIEQLKLVDRDAIEFAEVDAKVPPDLLPNDPLLGSEWHHSTIQSEAAWDSARGMGVTIGIGDSGVDCTHPDLASACVSGWNFYDNNSNTADVYGHGTKVAGTAAAVGDNANQITGVAYQSKIMPLRIADATGYGYYSYMGQAITYAADRGVKVVNLSFQGAGGSATIRSAAQYMKGKGGLVVVSEGNSGTQSTYDNSPYVINVSATDGSNNMASWSTFGADVDLSAPGVSILTTTNGGGTGAVSGTSFSAPMTAGVIGLIYSVHPQFTASQVESILLSSVDDFGATGWDMYYGWGRLNAFKAVTQAMLIASTTDSVAPTTPTNFVATSTVSTNATLSWSPSIDNVGVAGYNVYRNGVNLATTVGTNYTDSTVMAGTSYVYSVRAYDAVGNLSPSTAELSLTVPVAPFAILSVSVPSRTGSTATISWATSELSTGVVYYGTNASQLTQTMTDLSTSTNHALNLTGLTKRTTYYYKVVAQSTSGAQSISAVNSFVTKSR